MALRRQVLQEKNICDFSKVRNYIVNAFFDDDKHRALIVSEFGFHNGIPYKDLISLLQWKENEEKPKDINGIKNFWDAFESAPNKEAIPENFFTYDIEKDCLMKLNGTVHEVPERYKN